MIEVILFLTSCPAHVLCEVTSTQEIEQMHIFSEVVRHFQIASEIPSCAPGRITKIVHTGNDLLQWAQHSSSISHLSPLLMTTQQFQCKQIVSLSPVLFSIEQTPIAQQQANLSQHSKAWSCQIRKVIMYLTVTIFSVLCYCLRWPDF